MKKEKTLYRIFTMYYNCMGDYYGYSRQNAINNMFKSGNLEGAEYNHNYYVIKTSVFYKSFSK